MIAVVTPEKLQLSSGTVVRLLGQWTDYQVLLKRRGNKPNPRLKYRLGEILLMSPLAKHGREANAIADFIKILLDYLGQKYEAFTPITLDLPEISGIEPDYSFYLNHWSAVTGKDRIDWTSDPPPDLVLEIDVTSYTNVNDYLPYRVPEIWIYKQNQLLIDTLTQNADQLSQNSQYSPNIEVATILAEYLEQAKQQSSSVAMGLLRKNFPSSS
ncbi:MAG: Uma2 family endonuclease [Microcystaceae cyanobacterium]